MPETTHPANPYGQPNKSASLEAAIRMARVNARVGTPGAAERLAQLEALRGTGIYATK